MNIYLAKKPKRINSVSISVAIVLVIIGYIVWFVVPAWWPVFQLTGIMHGICNDAYRVHDDRVLMERLLEQGRRTGLDLSEDNFRLTRVPYAEEVIGAEENPNVRKLMRQRGKECVLEMHYEDDFAWPLIGKTTHISFDREVTKSLKQVEYQKQCTCVRAGSPPS